MRTMRVFLSTAALMLGGQVADAHDPPKGYQARTVEGWTVLVSEKLLEEDGDATSRTLKLLQAQLKTVLQVLPEQAVTHVRGVSIWLSPTYPGSRPTGEYHPDAGWLRQHGRHATLVRCIEFTNTPRFEQEVRRMPMLVLHELAHAYHHQVLGFDHPEIKAAYQRVVKSGTYNAVRRSNGKVERAYAMTNPKEYFAETTEAFFGTNDFYPFKRSELKQHDPEMDRLLSRLWGCEEKVADGPATSAADYRVTEPSAELKLDPFYRKYVNANGYPVISSAKVNDYALKEAAYLIDMMLAQRPDVRKAMIASGSRMIVMAHDECTTDVPEHSHMRPKDYWDARARGLGGSQTDPACSCGEENLLGFEGDPYSSENILIHEFAHNMHLRGLVNVDVAFDERLKQTYERAMAAGLWTGKYAAVNHAEYFAEGVQSWFDNNRQPDHDHNHVDTRKELREYDPGLAAICKEVFGDTRLVYSKPKTRLRGHLTGYDPSQTPTFRWPSRLQKAREEIRRTSRERSQPSNECDRPPGGPTNSGPSAVRAEAASTLCALPTLFNHGRRDGVMFLRRLPASEIEGLH